MHTYLWNQYGARFHCIRSCLGRRFNWLFLPGGPGLGSESLYDLIQCLALPGTLWCLDLPGDGSNTTAHNAKAFMQWPQALLNAVSALDQVILVGHSSGGMFALALPELEHKLMGLVLMDSAPDASWQKELDKMFQETPLEEVKQLTQAYEEHPSNEALKQLTVACAPYFFTQESLERGKALMNSLPYNFETFEWSAKNFDATYKALWVPQLLPTLILSGSLDRLTPLSAFNNQSAFHRENIMMREIADAGHFPWMERPGAVSKVFEEYVNKWFLHH